MTCLVNTNNQLIGPTALQYIAEEHSVIRDVVQLVVCLNGKITGIEVVHSSDCRCINPQMTIVEIQGPCCRLVPR